MEKQTKSLAEALGVGKREHIAFVGGGGKTSLMFALAGELRRAGKAVTTATTTKVWFREAQQAPLVVFAESDAWERKLAEGLTAQGEVFLAHRLLNSGKVEGIDVTLADIVYQDPLVDFLIVEADGSAGHPVKAPSAHEPVIADSATIVVAVMGLEALGKRMEPDTVFRMEMVEDITALHPGQTLTAPALSKLFLDHRGLFKETPASARRVVFLNKLDLATDEHGAMELADLIFSKASEEVERVVVGSLVKRQYQVRRLKNG